MRSLTSPQTPPASQIFVTVTGNVRQPGPLSLAPDARLTASGAIVRAGGFAPGASLTNCHVLRATGDGQEDRIPFNIMEVSKQPALDVTLQAGDTVVVPARDTSQRDALQAHLNRLAKALAERVSPGPLNAPLLHPIYPLKPPVPGLPTNSFTLLHPTLPPKPVQLAAAAPVPVAADVRRLTSPPPPDTKPGTQNQSLLTSAATSGDAPEEAPRQQEQKLALSKLLSKLLGEADQFRKIKSWTNAVVRYEEAAGLAKVLGGVETVEKRYREALAGLIHSRIQLAVELQEKHEFKAAAAEVEKIFPFYPGNAEAEQFKRFNDRVEVAHKAGLTSQPKLPEQRTEVMQLVRDGQLYWQKSDYREAKLKLEAAIAKDPLNEAAFFYLRLVMESEFAVENKKREKTYGDRVVEVEVGGFSKVVHGNAALPVPNPYAKTNSEVPFLTHSSKGAQRLNRKLEEIILPEVHFDGIPLAEVVKRLSEDAQKFDPEADPKKKGLNFLINDAVRPAPLLDASGNPVPVAQPVALSEGLIRVSTPLKNLTLRHALDVICKNAEQPTTFSVEEYAIAFIPRGDATFFSRMFRVSPDAFIQGLQGVVASPVIGVNNTGNAQGGQTQGQPAAGTTTGPVRATVPATATSSSVDINARVRQFFQSAGVTSLNATNPGTQVQFNPQTGLIRVRGTKDDLRIFEQSLRILAPLTNPAPTNPANPNSRTNSTIVTPPSPRTQWIKLEPMTRVFKVEPKVVIQGLKGVVVNPGVLISQADWQAYLRRLSAFDRSVVLNREVQEIFQVAGALGCGSTNDPTAPQSFFNDRTGLLLVRGTRHELNVMEQAIELLTTPLPSVFVKPQATINQATDVAQAGPTKIEPLNPKLPERPALFSRMFKVDPKTFVRELQSQMIPAPTLKERYVHALGSDDRWDS